MEQHLEDLNLQTPPPVTLETRPVEITNRVTPQQQTCPSCAASGSAAASVTPPSWIYAIGKIEARFPALAIEKGIRASLRTRRHCWTHRQAGATRCAGEAGE